MARKAIMTTCLESALTITKQGRLTKRHKARITEEWLKSFVDWYLEIRGTLPPYAVAILERVGVTV